MAKIIAQDELPNKIKVNEKTIELWSNTNLSFKNRSTGVFGATNTGKTTLIASLVKKIGFSLVLLITGDPNENGDLGAHLPRGLILNINDLSKGFFELLCRIQTARAVIFYEAINSHHFKELVARLKEKNQEYQTEYDKLYKEGQKKIINALKTAQNEIDKLRIKNMLELEMAKQEEELNLNYLQTLFTKQPELPIFNNISRPLALILSGRFVLLELVIIFDDFGARLSRNPDVNFLVTVNRKRNITIFFLAQTPRLLSPDIRDNMSIIICTSASAFLWSAQFLLHNNQNKALLETVAFLFATQKYKYPCFNIHEHQLTYVAADIYGNFSLIIEPFIKIFKNSKNHPKAFIRTLLLFSGIKARKKGAAC